MNSHYLRWLALSATLLVVCSTPTLAEEGWARFRGPNGSGLAGPIDLKLPFDTADDVCWKADLPGVGNSSPVIWGDRIFLLSGEKDGSFVYALCLDANNGEVIWKKRLASAGYHLHTKNTFASSTPAVDAHSVYIGWSDGEQTTLASLTHDGNVEWTTELGPWVSQHGFGVSPIVYDEYVILSLMQLGDEKTLNGRKAGQSRLVAMNRATGRIVWEAARDSDVAAYSVPCIYHAKDGRDLLICCSSAHGVAAHNPMNGDQIWANPVFNKRSVSSPVVIDGVVYGSCGSGGGGNYVVAVDPESGETIYRFDRSAPYVPGAVGKDGLTYLWYDKGIVTAIRTADGEKVWQQRIGGNYSGSPIIAGDKLINVSEDGEVLILATGEEFRELARFSLGEGSNATAAAAGGKLFVRTASHLYCLGEK
ncbi:PQQ-binding-like beta-propeller repeat protein [Blastopirellula sp. JC732]|uniref:PQQ-binding-like beta-propeller repeat protein n=1 Tax=Blastopirellula sediminis TaxID=2894196 RepID=A0A9X1MP49_9BACT|nr:PQQ-binding-like beta-propeller repeat protein [Blastopirellula sediminis]MCC9605797.1 PQQ-binding-like beta-propeller repeat protein [Blastopirellula sediminis]MCC9630903.1 PQQ-binding-like beta-propeller repeat protein [Blastopirellula sediminis]